MHMPPERLHVKWNVLLVLQLVHPHLFIIVELDLLERSFKFSDYV